MAGTICACLSIPATNHHEYHYYSLLLLHHACVHTHLSSTLLNIVTNSLPTIPIVSTPPPTHSHAHKSHGSAYLTQMLHLPPQLLLPLPPCLRCPAVLGLPVPERGDLHLQGCLPLFPLPSVPSGASHLLLHL